MARNLTVVARELKMPLENGTRPVPSTESIDFLSKSAHRAAVAERIVLLTGFAKTLGKTLKQVWRREWESFKPFAKIPMDAAVFSATLATAII